MITRLLERNPKSFGPFVGPLLVPQKETPWVTKPLLSSLVVKLLTFNFNADIKCYTVFVACTQVLQISGNPIVFPSSMTFLPPKLFSWRFIRSPSMRPLQKQCSHAKKKGEGRARARTAPGQKRPPYTGSTTTHAPLAPPVHEMYQPGVAMALRCLGSLNNDI